MNYGLHQIRYFVAVAHELHFRRAAQSLNLSQPALTRAIRLLEHAVGAKLFDRTNRSVTLTPAGQQFLEGCEAGLLSIRRAQDKARRIAVGEVGEVAIGYTDIAIAGFLPTLLQAFRAINPEINVTPVHGCTKSQIDDLELGKLDVGFLTGPFSQHGFSSVLVQEDRFVAVLPATHPLARHDEVDLTAFAEEPFVLGEPVTWTHYHAHLFRVCRAVGFDPHVAQYASNNECIFGLVACGMGVSIQAESVRNYLRQGLIIRPIRNLSQTVPTLAVWRSENVSLPTARFVSHVRAQPRSISS